MRTPGSPGLSGTVLLVGAAKAEAELVRGSLEALDWALEEAASLAMARRRLEGGRVDAILLEVELPDAGAADAVRTIRKTFPEPAVLMLSAPDRESDALAGLRAGAHDYVVRNEGLRSQLPRLVESAVERKRADDALHRLQAAVATMQLGVTVTGLDGRIVYVNRADAEMHGFTPAEMLGRDARSLSPRDEWSPLPPGGLRGLGRWKRERVRSRRDGSTFPVQLLSDVVTDADGTPLGIVTTCVDISERKQAEEALRRSDERYALAARGTNDGLFDWDVREGRILYSDRWKSMLGYGPEDIGEALHEWLGRVHPDDLGSLQALLRQQTEGRIDHVEHEHRVRHRDGLYRWVLCRSHAVSEPKGETRRIVGAQTDVTAHRPHDPLTGLANRVLFTERLRGAFARHRGARGLFAVLFVDLDHFKSINDQHGHHVGDLTLVEVARRLERCVRPGDTAARLAGDEFAVVLERLDAEQEATAIAERIQQELTAPVAGAPTVTPSASIGIALSTTGYEKPEDLLQEADTAMYRAKAEGRGRCLVFDTEMRRGASARQKVKEDLRQAALRGDFAVHYEPIVSVATGALTGLEAMLRWRGLLLPLEVLTLGEDPRWMARIGEWLLRESARQVSEWRSAYDAARNLRLGVNIQTAHFLGAELPHQVCAVLADTGLPPDALFLEVTEDALLREPSAAARVEDLLSMGVRLRLDRFGNGAASLNLLRRHPLAGVKLDPSIVASISSGEGEAGLFAGFVRLVQALRVPVIAVGVETAEQAAACRELSCDEAQGSFHGDPSEASALAAVLLRGES